jgi:hypothetical protein
MGGKISVDSELGKGTTFTISLAALSQYKNSDIVDTELLQRNSRERRLSKFAFAGRLS